MPPRQTPAAADSRPDAEGFIQTVLDRTYDLRQRKEKLQKEVAENRQTVRLLLSQGAFSKDQAKWVEEIYPPRKPKEEAEESAAA